MNGRMDGRDRMDGMMDGWDRMDGKLGLDEWKEEWSEEWMGWDEKIDGWMEFEWTDGIEWMALGEWKEKWMG